MPKRKARGEAIAAPQDPPPRKAEGKKRRQRFRRNGPVGSLENKATSLGVRMPPSMADRVEIWQGRKGERNLANAVRRLVQAGLDTNPGPREVGRLPPLESGTHARNHHFSPEMLAEIGVMIARLGGTLKRHRAILICIQLGLDAAEKENESKGANE